MQSASNVIQRNIHLPAVALSLLVLALVGCRVAPPVPAATTPPRPSQPASHPPARLCSHWRNGSGRPRRL